MSNEQVVTVYVSALTKWEAILPRQRSSHQSALPVSGKPAAAFMFSYGGSIFLYTYNTSVMALARTTVSHYKNMGQTIHKQLNKTSPHHWSRSMISYCTCSSTLQGSTLQPTLRPASSNIPRKTPSAFIRARSSDPPSEWPCRMMFGNVVWWVKRVRSVLIWAISATRGRNATMTIKRR